jgi:hypothetical protein
MHGASCSFEHVYAGKSYSNSGADAAAASFAVHSSHFGSMIGSIAVVGFGGGGGDGDGGDGDGGFGFGFGFGGGFGGGGDHVGGDADTDFIADLTSIARAPIAPDSRSNAPSTRPYRLGASLAKFATRARAYPSLITRSTPPVVALATASTVPIAAHAHAIVTADHRVGASSRRAIAVAVSRPSSSAAASSRVARASSASSSSSLAR